MWSVATVTSIPISTNSLINPANSSIWLLIITICSGEYDYFPGGHPGKQSFQYPSHRFIDKIRFGLYCLKYLWKNAVKFRYISVVLANEAESNRYACAEWHKLTIVGNLSVSFLFLLSWYNCSNLTERNLACESPTIKTSFSWPSFDTWKRPISFGT